ncbi:hypothetical protein DMN91_012800 [Ooceraea biroi]|uniref:Uncharacterized protein n=1 Tax=Ooceraea biroi TaxID=2015173 RepID=A0A3L8D4H4_OOCBI|nr:hypothetical protein DMN91_012800 [Ooceraea biroi]
MFGAHTTSLITMQAQVSYTFCRVSTINAEGDRTATEIHDVASDRSAVPRARWLSIISPHSLRLRIAAPWHVVTRYEGRQSSRVSPGTRRHARQSSSSSVAHERL